MRALLAKGLIACNKQPMCTLGMLSMGIESRVFGNGQYSPAESPFWRSTCTARACCTAT